MACGRRPRTTARCGTRRLLPAGLHTITDTVFGKRHGDGPGLTTSAGVLLHSTTAAGYMGTSVGDGLRDRSTRARSMRRRWGHGSAVDSGSVVGSGADLVR